MRLRSARYALARYLLDPVKWRKTLRYRFRWCNRKTSSISNPRNTRRCCTRVTTISVQAKVTATKMSSLTSVSTKQLLKVEASFTTPNKIARISNSLVEFSSSSTWTRVNNHWATSINSSTEWDQEPRWSWQAIRRIIVEWCRKERRRLCFGTRSRPTTTMAAQCLAASTSTKVASTATIWCRTTLLEAIVSSLSRMVWLRSVVYRRWQQLRTRSPIKNLSKRKITKVSLEVLWTTRGSLFRLLRGQSLTSLSFPRDLCKCNSWTTSLANNSTVKLWHLRNSSCTICPFKATSRTLLKPQVAS